MSSEQPTQPWYTQTWVAVVALVLFLPLGLFLMWRFQRWEVWIKTVITVVGSLFAILFIVSAIVGEDVGGDETVMQEATPSPTVEATPSPTVEAPTPSPKPTATPEPTPTPTASPTPDSGNGQPGDAQEIDLRVSVFDDSVDRPLENFEVWVRGYGLWYPDLSFGGDVNTLGAFPVGELQEQNFFIYPDGRDGTEIRVEFEMTADMISGSVRDTVIVDVSDTTVTVTGTAIPGITQEFER